MNILQLMNMIGDFSSGTGDFRPRGGRKTFKMNRRKELAQSARRRARR